MSRLITLKWGVDDQNNFKSIYKFSTSKIIDIEDIYKYTRNKYGTIIKYNEVFFIDHYVPMFSLGKYGIYIENENQKKEAKLKLEQAVLEHVDRILRLYLPIKNILNQKNLKNKKESDK